MYKVLLVIEEDLYSISYGMNGYAIQYKIGEWVKGKYPLFVFDKLVDAARHKNNLIRDYDLEYALEIWQVEAENVRESPSSVTSGGSCASIDKYWMDEDKDHYGILVPYGTKICDSVKLIEKVK